MIRQLIVLAPTLMLGCAVAAGDDFTPPSENIALGKSYRLDPRPNYAHCTDSGDQSQLTDGQYSRGYFWTQATTVGWNHVGSATITIDLGAVQPIRGVSFNTAAGRAGVAWPAGIIVLVSDDGKTSYPVGELVNLSMRHGAAPSDYATHRFWTDALRTHARYVTFLVTPGGPYAFVDEIEVYLGEPDWVKMPFDSDGVTDPKAYLLHAAFEQRIRKDLLAIRERANGASEDARPKILSELAAVEREIPSMPRQHDRLGRATLPLNPLHAKVFLAQSMLWRARGIPPITVWPANPWDPIDLHKPPPADPPTGIHLAMMRNEYRAISLNIGNAGDEPLDLRLQICDLPGGINPPFISVHEVAWTDTRNGQVVAAALPEARRDGDAYVIGVPAGMVRQVWLTFHPTETPPGTHRGTIRLTSGTTTLAVPVTLRLFPLRFPDRPTLHVGGWDYSDATKGRDVTPENRDAFVRHLREHFVDSPWATAGVLPQDLDTERFDQWLQLWPDARQYCVFASVGERFGNARMGTPEFEQKVREWAAFWANHAKGRGLRPEQLVILLVDEPAEERRDNIILPWAKAIRAANTGVRLFEDVCHPDPKKANQDMIGLCHILCPNRPRFLTSSPSYRDYFDARRAMGTELAFYSCNIGARLADPYSYFRLQAWTAWRHGATASHFWSFSDSGGGSSWNEYAMAHPTCYTPVFLEPKGITAGKHMEAIRESAEDYEYLVMLRESVAAAAKTGKHGPALDHAKALLATAAARVLDAPGANALLWADPKDRSVADAVRIEILEALVALGEDRT